MKCHPIYIWIISSIISCAPTNQTKRNSEIKGQLDAANFKAENSAATDSSGGYEIQVIESSENTMTAKYYPFKFARNMIVKGKSFKPNGDLVFEPSSVDLEKVKSGLIRVKKNKFNSSNKYSLEVFDKGVPIGNCFEGENVYIGKGHAKGFYMSNSGDPRYGGIGYSFGNQPGETQVDCGLGNNNPDSLDVVLKKNGNKIASYKLIKRK